MTTKEHNRQMKIDYIKENVDNLDDQSIDNININVEQSIQQMELNEFNKQFIKDNIELLDEFDYNFIHRIKSNMDFIIESKQQVEAVEYIPSDGTK